MKSSQRERLSEHLLNVDEEILSNAYEIDDAGKLKQYIKAKNKMTGNYFYKTSVFRTVAVIAACLALIVGVVFTVPVFFDSGNNSSYENNNRHEEAVPPWLREEEHHITIDSIDMLNYYTAMKALADPANATNTASYATAGEITLLYSSVNSKPYEFTYLFNTDGDVGYDTPPEDYTPDNNNKTPEKIIYYELDPNEVFYVTRVIFFQIEIKDSAGFLASKVGTGMVDVVITENSLEPMITFKNGDRYYSCCENTLLDNGKLYSTHKYIEGFYLVKNLEQENYSFSVVYDHFNLDYINVTAKSVTCDSYKNGGTAADGELSVISKTYISNRSTEMTVADLEEYFNSGKLPEGNGSGEINTPSEDEETDKVTTTIYTNGDYVFALDSNGTFIYYSISNDEIYRKGTYSMGCDAVELRFMYEGEVVEAVSCDFTGPSSFLYNRSEYTMTSSGGDQS